MTQEIYSIKEAAKELGVEAHALRYWEEELELIIGRNAQGRRIYTEEDMQTFRDIITWKEQGHSLRHIRELIRDNKQESTVDTNKGRRRTYGWENAETDRALSSSRDELGGHRIIVYRPKEAGDLVSVGDNSQEQKMTEADMLNLEKAEKARRLQELLKQFISESIRESNAELLHAMKEGLLKELDYQFRLQEEREEEREKMRIEKEDEHFRCLDENLRNAMGKRSKKRKTVFGR